MKGVDFKDGGGFQVNIGGDGKILYRPASKTRAAYFEITTPEHGTRRYDTSGKEIPQRTYDTSKYSHNPNGTISVSRVVDGHLPKDAKPYEVIDVRTTKGNINRTYFNAEGQRGQRIDSTDHGQPKHHSEGAHKHIMIYDENGNCLGDGDWISLNDKDRLENADIL